MKLVAQNNALIDTLIFNENTDIDNILLSIVHSDKSNIVSSI